MLNNNSFLENLNARLLQDSHQTREIHSRCCNSYDTHSLEGPFIVRADTCRNLVVKHTMGYVTPSTLTKCILYY